MLNRRKRLSLLIPLKQIADLQQKNQALSEDNNIYKALINAEEMQKPALNLQISNMTTSLRAINSEKAELSRKVEDYGKMIKALTTENMQMKETNERYKVALENMEQQKQSISQMTEEKAQNDMKQILRLDAENQALKDEINTIRSNLMMQQINMDMDHDEKLLEDGNSPKHKPQINRGPTPKFFSLNSTKSNVSTHLSSSYSQDQVIIGAGKTPKFLRYSSGRSNVSLNEDPDGVLVGIPDVNNLHRHQFGNTLSPTSPDPGHESDDGAVYCGYNIVVTSGADIVDYPSLKEHSHSHSDRVPAEDANERIGRIRSMDEDHAPETLDGHCKSGKIPISRENSHTETEVYPYIDEEDENEVVLDEHEKKLSQIIAEDNKIESLENEMSELYAEIEKLKTAMEELTEKNEELKAENEGLKFENETLLNMKQNAKLEITSDSDIDEEKELSQSGYHDNCKDMVKIGSTISTLQESSEENRFLSILFASFFFKS